MNRCERFILKVEKRNDVWNLLRYKTRSHVVHWTRGRFSGQCATINSAHLPGACQDSGHHSVTVVGQSVSIGVGNKPLDRSQELLCQCVHHRFSLVSKICNEFQEVCVVLRLTRFCFIQETEGAIKQRRTQCLKHIQNTLSLSLLLFNSMQNPKDFWGEIRRHKKKRRVIHFIEKKDWLDYFEGVLNKGVLGEADLP